MPILVYCISNRTACPSGLPVGVASLTVKPIEQAELTVFVSVAPDPAVWLQQPLRTAAVEFHRVCNQIFNSAAIIPFRFPTTFETEDELLSHLKERSEQYIALLERFRHVVQIEIHVTRNCPASTDSGAEFLRRKAHFLRDAEQFGNMVKQRLSPAVTEWRQRPSKGGFRVFALVNRNAIQNFEDALRLSSVPNGIKVRVSGPWPVSEFIEQA